MVAKIKYGNFLKQTLIYNSRKIEDGEAKVLLANRLFTPPDGKFSVTDCMVDFQSFIPSHCRTERPVIHISLNPHPDDRLTDEQFAAIAEEYMERLGYGAQPYIVYKHEDISRHHLHIVSLRVDEQGRKLDDRFEFRRSKEITRDIELKYGLHRAESREQIEIGNASRIDPARGDVEQQIRDVVMEISSRYRYLSLNEYRAVLSLYKVNVQEQQGEVKGVRYDGLVYFATDDNGVTICPPIKASEIDRAVGYKAIMERIECNKSQVATQRLNRQTAYKVRDALNNSTHIDSFAERLKDKNIDVIFRKNGVGRLYGVTFIDHNNSCVFNGSRLGRDLSANAIAERFENPKSSQQGECQDAGYSQSQEYYNEELSLGGLFDLPIDSGIDDPEEERFHRAMQRKKKRKIKM